MMGLIACVIGAFLLAAYLRKRRNGVVASIALGGLVFPIAVAFTSLVYPAEPEARMWAAIAVPVSYLWGLVAAGFGCGFMFLLQRAEREA